MSSCMLAIPVIKCLPPASQQPRRVACVAGPTDVSALVGIVAIWGGGSGSHDLNTFKCSLGVSFKRRRESFPGKMDENEAKRRVRYK